ncbi:ABC transporter permease [Chloroflexi bacterium TSY]|nr:ABC transporter permease [Chloroflexi bacterium TSY]
MRTYILRRLAISVPILLGLTLVTFILAELMPGDFVSGMMPPNAAVSFSPEQLEIMRENYGLNRPPHERYFIWLRELARGNLGYSLVSGASVRDEILERLPATLQLTMTSLLFGIIVGAILGIIAAVKQYSWIDQLLTILGFFWISTPGFVFAIGAIYLFSLKIPLFPTSGITNYGESATFLTRVHHMILPATVLGLGSVASFMRYARGSMLDVIRQDYITVARAKGLAERATLLVHALRNALIPVITIIGLNIPYLIGGTVIIEFIFAWPGMGTYSLGAIFARDYPVIMGVNFTVALVVLLSNLITDITYAFVDPRIRYE